MHMTSIYARTIIIMALKISWINYKNAFLRPFYCSINGFDYIRQLVYKDNIPTNCIFSELFFQF